LNRRPPAYEAVTPTHAPRRSVDNDCFRGTRLLLVLVPLPASHWKLDYTLLARLYDKNIYSQRQAPTGARSTHSESESETGNITM